MNDRAMQHSRFKGKVGNGLLPLKQLRLFPGSQCCPPLCSAVQSRENAHLISGVSNRHYMSAPMCSIPLQISTILHPQNQASNKPSFHVSPNLSSVTTRQITLERRFFKVGVNTTMFKRIDKREKFRQVFHQKPERATARSRK